MLLAQFYYYLYGKNEIFLTDIHRWNFTRETTSKNFTFESITLYNHRTIFNFTMHLYKYFLLFVAVFFFNINYSIAETTSDAIANGEESKYPKNPTFVTTQTKIKNKDTCCKSIQDENDVLKKENT